MTRKWMFAMACALTASQVGCGDDADPSADESDLHGTPVQPGTPNQPGIPNSGGTESDAGFSPPAAGEGPITEIRLPDSDPNSNAPRSTGTLWGLYTYPTDRTWARVVEVKKAHPRVPIVPVINPNSGPGTQPNQDYVTGIGKLAAVGCIVLGYVPTGYATTPEATVTSQIDKYAQWYPQVTGIFFDEMFYLATGKEEYYRRLTAYAKSKGFKMTVGNPGADSRPSYVGTVDVIAIYEDKGLPTDVQLGGWHANHPKENFSILPHSVPGPLNREFIQRAKAHVGYIFVTDDTTDPPEKNPWNSLPKYFDDLIAELDR